MERATYRQLNMVYLVEKLAFLVNLLIKGGDSYGVAWVDIYDNKISTISLFGINRNTKTPPKTNTPLDSMPLIFHSWFLSTFEINEKGYLPQKYIYVSLPTTYLTPPDASLDQMYINMYLV